MKKKFSWLICLTIGALAFVACNSDDDNGSGGSGTAGITGISVKVDKGSSYSSIIDSVCVELEWEDKYNWGSEIIARSAYKNGDFTLNLPDKLDDSFLSTFDETEDESMLENIQISDISAKTAAFVNIDAYSNKEGYVGYIIRSNVDMNYLNSLDENDIDKMISILSNGIYLIMYVYADKPVTLKGSYTIEEEELLEGLYGKSTNNVNISLLKGWNVVAEKLSMQFNYVTGAVTGTTNMTTSEPSGLKWYFYGYDDYGMSLSSASKSSFKSAPLLGKSKALKFSNKIFK